MSSGVLQELDWMDDLLEKLPATKHVRKDLFSIAGFPARETVISNVLAFYFDPEEEHLFGSLFLNSLLQLAEDQAPLLLKTFNETAGNNGFQVDREWSISEATKRGYIDILIRSKELPGVDHSSEKETTEVEKAIIIENKFGADLYNDLSAYYRGVSATKKIGVVLDLIHHTELPEGWVSITHQELLASVMRNLGMAFAQADDRHLLLLKEFATNLTNHTMSMDHELQVERLKAWHEHEQQIAKLYQLRRDLGAYVGETMDKVMLDHGMSTTARNSFTEYRTYHPDPVRFPGFDKEAEGMRAWISLWEVLDKGQFRMHFELFGKANTIHGPVIAQELEQKIGLTKLRIWPPEAQSTNYGYYHLAVVTGRVEVEADLHQALKMLVERALAPELGLVKAALEQLRKHLVRA